LEQFVRTPAWRNLPPPLKVGLLHVHAQNKRPRTTMNSFRSTPMYARVFAAETGGTSAVTDISDNYVALRADVAGLAEAVKRLATEAPDLALESLASPIRRNPVQSTLIAVGIGFLLCLIVTR
jgi:hypothetical protein